MSSAHNKNIIDTSKNISDVFETGFLKTPLDQQIAGCETDELVPLYKRVLPENQPILEAGSGSGRWVAWFIGNGWRSVGLDLSEALCVRARRDIPGGRFVCGDIRATPFEDGEFGSIVALGSVEHLIEGPVDALKEFHRILRPNGIAIITVPHAGVIRKIRGLMNVPLLLMKASSILRRILGKQDCHGKSLIEAKRETVTEWSPVCRFGEKGWCFSEYYFTKKQMRQFLMSNGFSIVEEVVHCGDKGIIFSFGKIAGSYNDNEIKVHLTPIGKLIRRMIPDSCMSHMVCYVARRV